MALHTQYHFIQDQESQIKITTFRIWVPKNAHRQTFRRRCWKSIMLCTWWIAFKCKIFESWMWMKMSACVWPCAFGGIDAVAKKLKKLNVDQYLHVMFNESLYRPQFIWFTLLLCVERFHCVVAKMRWWTTRILLHLMLKVIRDKAIKINLHEKKKQI